MEDGNKNDSNLIPTEDSTTTSSSFNPANGVSGPSSDNNDSDVNMVSAVQKVINTAHRTLDTKISALSDRDPVAIHAPSNNNSNNNQEDDDTIATNADDFDDTKTSVTFGGQTELPPLPIPSLEETLNKFLKCLDALYYDYEEQKEASQAVVLEFLQGEGPKLQQLLLEYDRTGRERGEIGSYVEEFWNDAYLAPDSSVVLNLNPYFVLESSPDPKLAGNQIRRAASLCFASVKMASTIRKEDFKPDTFRGKPLCMDQFHALFGASRVPKRNEKDVIAVYDRSNHVAVMCCNQLYYFQALWPDGDVAVDEGDLCDILEAIHAHAHKYGKDDDEESVGDDVEERKFLSSLSAVGVLTSLNRKEWAMVREELVAHSPRKNSESLTIVDSALFVLVLDDYIPPNKHAAAANMLHGSYELTQRKNCKNLGKRGDKEQSPFILPCEQYQSGSCTNRWYDKLQIIVTKDGNAGINFEHSAIDGHTALRFVSDIYADTIISFAQSITKMVQAHDGFVPNVIDAKVKRAAVTLDDQGRTSLDVFPKKINFSLPDSIKRKIHHAETALGDQIVASDTFVLEFKDYGKRFITSNKLSPDSYVQMSMMLAYYKLYGRVVCAYEPVLTKSFYHGRTEAMRPGTMEVKHLCEVFCNPRSSSEEKLAVLRNAVRVHSALVKECARGKGVDRHLFALKCIAEKHELPVPDFFRSEPWKMLNHTILSTSNCGNPSLALFGFGPVVPDGLGIGYIIKDNGLNYAICSKHRQTARYAMTLEAVLKEMAHLLGPAPQTKVVDHRLHSDTTRLTLKQIPVHAIAYDAYGDIWGESTPSGKHRKVSRVSVTDVPEMPALASVPTAVVSNTKSTPALVSVPADVANNTTIIPLKDKPSGVEQERRWSAEEIKPLDASNLVEDEVDAVVLQMTQGMENEKRLSAEIELNDSSQQLQSPIKRRGSNDKLPTKPNRRGSNGGARGSGSHAARRHSSRENKLVGFAQRKSSFEYSDLSKKGDSILFERLTDDHEP